MRQGRPTPSLRPSERFDPLACGAISDIHGVGTARLLWLGLLGHPLLLCLSSRFTGVAPPFRGGCRAKAGATRASAHLAIVKPIERDKARWPAAGRRRSYLGALRAGSDIEHDCNCTAPSVLRYLHIFPARHVSGQERFVIVEEFISQRGIKDITRL